MRRSSEGGLKQEGGNRGDADDLRAALPQSVAMCQELTHAAQQQRPHSITRSARTRIVFGIEIPRTSAVFRLSENSIRVGCSTGKSAGLAPSIIFFT
jgi:hypothetical protein